MISDISDTGDTSPSPQPISIIWSTTLSLSVKAEAIFDDGQLQSVDIIYPGPKAISDFIQGQLQAEAKTEFDLL